MLFHISMCDPPQEFDAKDESTLTTRLDTFPQNCWELMERCWASDPEKRPSMDAVVKDLEEILRDPN